MAVDNTPAAPDSVEADIARVTQDGFCKPETVLALPDDTLLISNVCDFRQSGNGFLSPLSEQGQAFDWRVLTLLKPSLSSEEFEAYMTHVIATIIPEK